MDDVSKGTSNQSESKSDYAQVIFLLVHRKMVTAVSIYPHVGPATFVRQNKHKIQIVNINKHNCVMISQPVKS